MALKSITIQDHGENCPDVIKAGAVKPLVELVKGGSSDAAKDRDLRDPCRARAPQGQGPGGAEDDRRGGRRGSDREAAAHGRRPVQTSTRSARPSATTTRSRRSPSGRASAGGDAQGGSAAAQAYAAQALANAAAYSAEDGQHAIAKAGAVPVLLTLLSSGSRRCPPRRRAKLAANNRSIQEEITQAGGIAPLLALLNGLDIEAQVQAAAALAEMARDNAETQAAIAKAGGIPPLLGLLASRSGPLAGAAQSKAMAALAQLARHNDKNQNAIAQMGGIKPLVAALGRTSRRSPRTPRGRSWRSHGKNAANQKTIVDNGGVSQLANLMRNSQHARVKAEVAGALWSLSADPEIKVSIATASRSRRSSTSSAWATSARARTRRTRSRRWGWTTRRTRCRSRRC